MTSPALLDRETTAPPARPRPRRKGRFAALGAVAALALAAEIAAAVIGHGGYAAVLFGILLFTGFGTAVALTVLAELRRFAWFDRHGVAVMAEPDHRAGRRAYRYTDAGGASYTYLSANRAERKTVRYDPDDPARAVEHVSFGERCVLAAGGGFGAILACGGLFAVTRLFGQALGE
ncbi:hypothetical protein Afil01_65850 [Actinorhabdospora filicis]|uniref:DUF3592 domain-containing protein n=1 Tax=Actinorhabdospora filicis TaxID=1785913 RepID=A0A9W6STH8_9ACTN|nr:hypothetical protein [Actinorhabdospora filicis]GLZ81778.1 hypothetical protein Afil01_65850 [Actinorhabdospora filicis]